MSSPSPPRDPLARRQLLLPVSQLVTARPEQDVQPLAAAGPTELQALWGFVDAILSATAPAGVAELLLTTAVGTYGFARGVVLLGERPLVVVATHATSPGEVGRGTSATVTDAQALQHAQVLAHPNALREPLLSRLFPASTELLVVPLADRRRLGALVVELPEVMRGRRRDHVLAQLSRLASSASTALSRELRLAQLERLAATDDLTMIANRRSFNTSLDREIARSVRNGEPVSLALLDLDLFKQVNDRFGHPAGDESLRNVAASLVVASRDVDTPARYGGEEFVVILPNCPAVEAVAITERLRAAVAAAPGVMRLTASAGVATFPIHATSGDDLVEAADAALLAAKAAGRDRTVLSSPESARPPS